MNRILYSVVFLATVIADTTNTFNEPDIWSHSLVKRASNGNGFDSFVDKMSLSARVMTGISLEIGLMDSSIPADAAVSEMLNIGEATLEDLEKFDKKALDEFVAKLETKNTVWEDVEKQLTQLSDVVKLWGRMRDMSRIPDNKKMQFFHNLPSDQNLSAFFSKSYIFVRKNQTDVNGLLPLLGEILEDLDKLKKSMIIDEFIGILNDIQPLWTLKEVLEALRGLDLSKIANADQNAKTALENDFQRMKSVTLGNVNWKLLKAIVTAPFSVNPKKVTSGFVDGYRDIKKLPDDLKDGLFAGKVPELKNLKALHGNLKKLYEDQFQKIAKIGIYRSIENIENLKSGLDILKSSSGDLDVVISAIANCPVPAAEPKKDEVAEKLIYMFEDMREAVQHLAVLKKLLELVIDEHTTLVKKAIADGSATQKVSEFLEKVRRLIKNLMAMPPQLSIIYGLVRKNPKEYFDNSLEDRKFIECLAKNVKTENSKAFVTSAMFSRVRKLNPTVLQQIRTVSSILANSVPIAKNIRKTLNTAKNTKSEKLMKLKDIQKRSKDFGDAVTAVVMTRKTLALEEEKEKVVTKSLQIGRQLRMESEQLNDVKLKEDVGKCCGNAEKEYSEGVKMVNQMNNTKIANFGNLPDPKSLSTFAPFFEDFSSFPSIDLRIREKLAVVDRLKELITNKDTLDFLAEVEKNLLEVATLDLQFSKYSSSVKGISDTLLDLDQVMGGKSVEPAGRPGAQAAQAGAAGGANGSSGGGSGSTLIIVGVVVGVLVVLGVIIGVVIYLKKKKNKEKNKKSSEGGKKNGSKEENEQKSPGDGGDGDASPASPSPSPAGSKDGGGSKEGSKEAGSKEKVKGSKERADGGAELLV